MEQYYKCIKEFAVDMYDDDECLIENEEKVIPVDSVWEYEEESYSMSDIRLTIGLSWIDIDTETLATHFVKM